MSGRLLDFKQYLGGADNVVVLEMFPSNAKQFTYTFPQNVGAYTFTADYQTLLLDTVTYDRNTGDANFADTNVLGHFGNYTSVPGSNIDETQASSGIVKFTIPQSRYTGPIFPNARTNVAATVVSFEWDNGASKELHRYVILERWEPGTTPGDPQLYNQFAPMGVGAVLAVTESGADSARIPGTYVNVSGLSSSQGTGASFDLLIGASGTVEATIKARGTTYDVGETITISDSQIGSGGGEAIVLTVSSIS